MLEYVAQETEEGQREVGGFARVLIRRRATYKTSCLSIFGYDQASAQGLASATL